MQTFGKIPFIKPQNDTSTTDKRLKTMKNAAYDIRIRIEMIHLNQAGRLVMGQV